MSGDYIPSGELGLEGVEYLGDVAGKLRQQWDDRLVLGRANLLKRYYEGLLTLQVHFSLLGFAFQNYAAVFHWNGVVENDGRSSLYVDAGVKYHFGNAREENGDSHDEQVVLVGIVQVMEHPQGIRFCGGTSMKRLEIIDQLGGGGGNALYHGVNSGFVTLNGCEDGETAFGGRGDSGLFVQLPDQKIERRSLVVKRLADQDANVWRDWLTVLQDKAQPLGFGVILGSNSVGVVMGKGLEGRLNIEDTLVGPFNF